MNYFVYVKDILAVETNLKSFSWSYGTNAPKTDRESFEKCKIKVYLNVVPDKCVPTEKCEKFSYFTTSEDKKSLYYNKSFFKFLNLSYNLRIDGNSIYMTCGKNYYNFVHCRFMNMHSVGYTLTDVVEAVLLKNNLSTLYCSSVATEDNNCLCIFGAPSTGKTLTSLSLCNKLGAKLVAEDFAVTDGGFVWGASFTHTHRKYNIEGLEDYIEIESGPCRLRNIAVIEKGKENLSREKNLRKIKCLQRYGLGYIKSPALTAFNYFNNEFDIREMEKTEDEILDKIIEKCEFISLTAENTLNFKDVLADNI